MVDDQDVRMPVTPGGVGMHGDHVVSAVHAFCEADGHVPDTPEVSLRRHVELVWVKCQHITLKLILPTMSSGVRLGTGYELPRSPPTIGHRQCVRSRTS